LLNRITDGTGILGNAIVIGNVRRQLAARKNPTPDCAMTQATGPTAKRGLFVPLAHVFQGKEYQ
jgi:hypothetical protein